MYAELSFKMHMQANDKCEGLSLYKVVEENRSTGRGQKSEFQELEVNIIMIT